MRPRLWLGPMLVLAWQTAPDIYRLTVGAEAGQFEDRTIACDGSVTSATPIDLARVGAVIDAWFDQGVRVQASASGGDLGGLGIARLQGEWKHVGLGAGVGRGTTVDGAPTWFPSWYLRLGNADRLHVLVDVFPPDLGPVSGGYIRMGVGYRRGRAAGPGGFLGLVVPPFADESYLAALHAEVTAPVRPNIEVVLRGLVADGYARGTVAVGAGVRATFH